MSELDTKFETGAKEAKQLPSRPDNDTLLKLYALYKQATVSNVAGKRPDFTNPVDRTKYDAWTNERGTSKEDAMHAYIDLVESLKG